MDKPLTINVAGLNYKVVVTEYFKASDDDRNLWGYCDYGDLTIYIRKSLSEERKQQTLIHELTHAVFSETGFTEQDEETVTRLSSVLYQVLKQNPHIFTFQS